MITASRVRKLLSYQKSTGLFRWRVRPSNRVGVGQIAGANHIGGARRIGVEGVSYLAHHLAALYVTGRWPHGVAFRNGQRSDTRWRNLEVA